MNEVHVSKKENYGLLNEKIDVADGLIQRYRRQILQAKTLQKKILLLLDELKRLQISIKTSTKEINLSLKELKESSTLFTEAVDPSSYDWNLQYELRKIEENFQECTEILEQFFETEVPQLPTS